MHTQIETSYDDQIRSFIIWMPEYTTLNALKKWRSELLTYLEKIKIQEKIALLIHTNTHEFESIACLKFMREFLTLEHKIVSRISRIAFVQPSQFQEPEIKNSNLGYFTCFKGAHSWLKENV